MRFVLLAIVLTFPIVDLYITTRIARWNGIPVWGWLAAGFLGGLWLLRKERLSFRANTLAALHGEQSLLRGFQVSAENPFLSVEGRCTLLQRLGRTVTNAPAVFGREDALDIRDL